MTVQSFVIVSLISQSLLLVQANLFRGDGDEGLSTTSESSFSKENRIIGGEKAETGRYPYSVSMQTWRGHYCGGTLIGKDTVLTAAHCFDGTDPSSIVIGNDEVNAGQRLTVKKTFQHPSYNRNTDAYDLGLVFLTQSTTLDIPLIRLNDDDSYPETGSTTYTMGWGATDPGDNQRLSDDLLVTDVRVISNDDCKNMKKSGENYGSWIFDDMMCAYTDGQDACQGDSGGPLITRGANGAQSDVLVGVVSWGSGCAFLPGVYSRVSKGYGWIRETVCEESNDPPGSLCGTQRATNRPTNIPTKNPTRFPTKQPTEFPTHFPTKNPTKYPTVSPTTAKPTFSPTEAPTPVPSLSSAPSDSPSASPSTSSQPSIPPTNSPSISLSPSSLPSSSPTTSSQPSISPSTSPSTSSSPSVLASAMPSLIPSNSPTLTISPSMSSNPTLSLAPSSVPSEEKPERHIPGNSLLISSVSAISEGEEETINASRMGHFLAIGAFLSNVISIWMVIR